MHAPMHARTHAYTRARVCMYTFSHIIKNKQEFYRKRKCKTLSFPPLLNISKMYVRICCCSSEIISIRQHAGVQPYGIGSSRPVLNVVHALSRVDSALQIRILEIIARKLSAFKPFNLSVRR